MNPVNGPQESEEAKLEKFFNAYIAKKPDASDEEVEAAYNMQAGQDDPTKEEPSMMDRGMAGFKQPFQELGGSLKQMAAHPLDAGVELLKAPYTGAKAAYEGISNAAQSNQPWWSKAADIGGRLMASPVDIATGGWASHMINRGQDTVASGDNAGAVGQLLGDTTIGYATSRIPGAAQKGFAGQTPSLQGIGKGLLGTAKALPGEMKAGLGGAGKLLKADLRGPFKPPPSAPPPMLGPEVPPHGPELPMLGPDPPMLGPNLQSTGIDLDAPRPMGPRISGLLQEPAIDALPPLATPPQQRALPTGGRPMPGGFETPWFKGAEPMVHDNSVFMSTTRGLPERAGGPFPMPPIPPVSPPDPHWFKGPGAQPARDGIMIHGDVPPTPAGNLATKLAAKPAPAPGGALPKGPAAWTPKEPKLPAPPASVLKAEPTKGTTPPKKGEPPAAKAEPAKPKPAPKAEPPKAEPPKKVATPEKVPEKKPYIGPKPTKAQLDAANAKTMEKWEAGKAERAAKAELHKKADAEMAKANAKRAEKKPAKEVKAEVKKETAPKVEEKPAVPEPEAEPFPKQEGESTKDWEARRAKDLAEKAAEAKADAKFAENAKKWETVAADRAKAEALAAKSKADPKSAVPATQKKIDNAKKETAGKKSPWDLTKGKNMPEPPKSKNWIQRHLPPKKS